MPSVVSFMVFIFPRHWIKWVIISTVALAVDDPRPILMGCDEMLFTAVFSEDTIVNVPLRSVANSQKRCCLCVNLHQAGTVSPQRGAGERGSPPFDSPKPQHFLFPAERLNFTAGMPSGPPPASECRLRLRLLLLRPHAALRRKSRFSSAQSVHVAGSAAGAPREPSTRRRAKHLSRRPGSKEEIIVGGYAAGW